MTLIKIEAQVPWIAFRDKFSDNWVGVCEPLKLTVEGESWSDLQTTINDTLEGVFEVLLEDNTLDEFLRSHGWKRLSDIPAKKKNHIRFDIPFTVSRENHHQFAHA